jgi:amidase
VPAGWKLKLPPPRHEALAEFRVAWWMGDGVFPLDDGCRQAIERYLAELRRVGLKVTEVEPPVAMTAALETYLHTLFAVFSPSMPASEESPRAIPLTGRLRDYAERIAKYSATSYREWYSLQDQREHIFLAFREFFNSFDVLICPIAPTVAFPHNIIERDTSRLLTVNGKPEPYMDMMMWSSLASNANLPATAMPTGQLVDGLPSGVQIIGPYLGDYTTIRFAELAERELGEFRPPPAVG